MERNIQRVYSFIFQPCDSRVTLTNVKHLQDLSFFSKVIYFHIRCYDEDALPKIPLLWMTKGGNFIDERYPNGEKSKNVVLLVRRRTAEKI